MADNILKAIITADASGFTKEVSKINSQTTILKTQFERLQKIASLPNLSFRQQERLNGLLLNTKSALGKAEQGFKSIAPASNQATLALSNLGRVAQDAPFGFIGIANNLNPLLESFQRLKATTGTTGGALKALGSSLTGAGGLGLALSVVSSLAIVFSDKLFGTSKAAKEAADANKELANGISGDIVKLSSLVAIIKNVNTSNTDRARALKIVNDEYGKYLPSLNKEEISLKNIGDAYDRIIDSLLRQAVVKGLQDEVEKAVSKTAAAIINLEKTEIKRNNTQTKVLSTNKQELSDNEKITKGLRQYNAAKTDGLNAAVRSEQLVRGEVKTLNSYEETLTRLKTQLKKDIEPLFGVLGNFKLDDLSVKEAKVKTPSLKIEPEKIEIPQNVKPVINLKGVFDQIEFESAALGRQTDPTFQEKLDEYIASQNLKIKVPPEVQLPESFKKSKDQAAKMAKLANDLAGSFNSAFEGAINGSLVSLGESIGNVLSGKGFGASIINVIGDLLSQIGKALIQYGVIKTGLDKILGPGGIAIPGALAIGLGASAIAFGQIFKNFGGFREAGGPVSSGRSYIVGENGPEIFNPGVSGNIVPNGRINSFNGGGLSGMMGKVVFEISGNKLIGVLANGNRSQTRLV